MASGERARFLAHSSRAPRKLEPVCLSVCVCGLVNVPVRQWYAAPMAFVFIDPPLCLHYDGSLSAKRGANEGCGVGLLRCSPFPKL